MVIVKKLPSMALFTKDLLPDPLHRLDAMDTANSAGSKGFRKNKKGEDWVTSLEIPDFLASVVGQL